MSFRTLPSHPSDAKKIHLESLDRSRRLVDPTSKRKLGKTHDFNDGFLTGAKTLILLNWSVLGISPFDEDDILTELPACIES